MNQRPISRWLVAGSLVLYGLLLGGLVGGMFLVRHRALASLDSSLARTQWEDWRAAAGRQDGVEAPVARRVPASVEPPTLVLLRDHFTICLTGGVLLTSLVYWALALMIRGAAWGPSFEVEGPATGGPGAGPRSTPADLTVRRSP